MLGAVTVLAVSGSALTFTTPAYAAASGCTVGRGYTTGSSQPNRGFAQCQSLTNGSQVRVKLSCANGSTVYGPWIGAVEPNRSYANCPTNVAARVVDYQNRTVRGDIAPV